MNPWVVVVGSAGDGKNVAAAEIVRACVEAGLRVGGVVEEAVVAADVVEGYDAVDVRTAERIALAQLAPVPDLCRFRFDENAFVECAKRLRATDLDVVVLEAAALEAASTGNWPAITAALHGRAALLVLCVRAKVLAAIALRLPDPAASLELPADATTLARFARDVVALAKERQLSATCSTAR